MEYENELLRIATRVDWSNVGYAIRGRVWRPSSYPRVGGSIRKPYTYTADGNTHTGAASIDAPSRLPD